MTGGNNKAGIGEDWNEFRRLVAARVPSPVVARLVHSRFFTVAVSIYALLGVALILALIFGL